jgi:hypothetical protein
VGSGFLCVAARPEQKNGYGRSHAKEASKTGRRGSI